MDVVDKLKALLRQSGRSIEIVFKQFDIEQNGLVTKVQFKRALRLLNLGLTEQEINSLLDHTQETEDGLINFRAFTSKFKDGQAFDTCMRGRASPKLAQLKQLMKYHMTSTTEAFRMVSKYYYNDFV